jgi:hypothetical protein
MAELFGFELSRTDKKKSTLPTSFVAPEDDAGSTSISGGGHYGQYIDLDGNDTKNSNELILKYRNMAGVTECDAAVEDIINEAIINENGKSPISVDVGEIETSDAIKALITKEFDTILKLTNVKTRGHDLFKKWYIDGRVYHHIIVDLKRPNLGIQEIRYIDPTLIRKVKEVEKDKIQGQTADIIKSVKEYYLYQSSNMAHNSEAVKVHPDSISHVTSGLMDPERKRVISYMHKALKPANQLKLMEDSLVIYRVARAPERRIFYIDVGNLPKTKAEAYLKGIMDKYRNKMVYDASTGEVKDSKKHMSALEDFWLPRREGGRGTEITSLPGGQSLGEIDDIVYFQKKLYKSLNVPISRLDQETSFSVGRSTEITRDEVKFSKFINKLRSKFSEIFIGLLRTQLLLKKVVSADDWENIKDDINIIFQSNVHFAELKDAEILRERVETLGIMEEHIGTYYSREYVRKNILMQTDEEIKDIDDQIAKEIESGDIDDDDDDDDLDSEDV